MINKLDGMGKREAAIFDEIFSRRDATIKSLMETIGHESKEKIIIIITSFMSIEEVEAMAKFQKDRLG
jgi:uncharacterized protein YjgD (DUF1641 family)